MGRGTPTSRTQRQASSELHLVANRLRRRQSISAVVRRRTVTSSLTLAATGETSLHPSVHSSIQQTNIIIHHRHAGDYDHRSAYILSVELAAIQFILDVRLEYMTMTTTTTINMICVSKMRSKTCRSQHNILAPDVSYLVPFLNPTFLKRV